MTTLDKTVSILKDLVTYPSVSSESNLAIINYLANKILTFLCNIFTNLNMTDMETGFKLVKKKYLDKIDIKEKSFGVEPELTIKLAKQKLIFYEVPISYKGRSYDEGKKIHLKDAFRAIFCIVYYKFFD